LPSIPKSTRESYGGAGRVQGAQTIQTLGITAPNELSGFLNDGPPVEPRPSATVLVMRGTKPWELLLMRRPGGADFAPGAYVFPGGTVHAQDAEWGDQIRAAAVRELFEEMGVLLARKGGRFARAADVAQIGGMIDSGLGFATALKAARLEPAFDRLVFLARWVTPVQLRRRFDARFFLARMPAGQDVSAEADEVTDWMWISPEKALRDESLTLVYATRTVLESVATREPAAAVIARARRQRDAPIIQPRLIETEEGWKIVH
jgi:recombination protein RecT